MGPTQSEGACHCAYARKPVVKIAKSARSQAVAAVGNDTADPQYWFGYIVTAYNTQSGEQSSPEDAFVATVSADELKPPSRSAVVVADACRPALRG